MPIYEFICSECKDKSEMRVKFDTPYPPCSVCGKPLEKQFSAVPVHFKGSGWASTDLKRPRQQGSVWDNE